MDYYVYILANLGNVAIYVGVTRDLIHRVWQHKEHLDPASYTARYHVDRLVYYERTTSITAAIEREKQLKSWSRKRKNALVSSTNPNWEDLYPGLLG